MEQMLPKDPISHEDVETLGGRIARARESLGMTTSQLARRVGIKVDTLTKWEHDISEPRTNKLVALAGLLNVSPTWLIMGRGDGPDDELQNDEMHVLQQELARAKEQAQNLTDMIEMIEKRVQRAAK